MADETLERLKKLIQDERYEEAAVLLPRIKEQKAKTASDYLALAKAYGKTGDFEKSVKLYSKAYKQRPSKLLFREMLDMCIELDRIREAEKYYSDYLKMAPQDTFNILLYKYKIMKKNGAGRLQLIDALITLNDCDYTEKYGYELAKELHKAGMAEECCAECKRIVENFEDSTITRKASTLLAYYMGEITAEEIKSAVTAAQALEATVTPTPQVRFDELQDSYEEMAVTKEPEVNEPEVTEPEVREPEVREPEVSETEAGEPEVSELEVNEPEADFLDMSSIALDVQEIINDELKVEAVEPEVEAVVPEEEPETLLVDETDIKEQNFKWALNNNMRSRTAPQYQIYAPRSSLGLNELKDGKAKNLIMERRVPIDEICKNFLRIDDARRSIYKSMELAVNERGKICLVITGEPGSGKTTLAIRMVKLFCKMGILKYDRVAKIDGEVLNDINLKEKKAQLETCNILVENAGKLKEKTLDNLLHVFGNGKSGTCIILEDNMRSITSLLRGKEEYMSKFNNRIHLPKYGDDDLMGFCFDIFREEEYSIEAGAADRLRKKLAAKSSEERKVEMAARLAKEIVENADRRLAPSILKMAADAAFDGYTSLVIVSEDLIP